MPRATKPNKGVDFSKDFDERSEVIEGTNSADSFGGGGGNDELYGYGGNDTLGGGHGNDSLYGDAGDDVLGGGRDDDFLSGGEGNDALYGSFGNDLLQGGAGDDLLTGGRGMDTFVFGVGAGNDVVTDFDQGNDQLDVSAWGAAWEDLSIITTEAGSTIISHDDMTITLQEVADVTVDDFIL